MGLQQIILVVSIRHHVKAEQMREMPTRRSSPPPKDNGKSQEPGFGPEGFSHHNSANEETTAGETLRWSEAKSSLTQGVATLPGKTFPSNIPLANPSPASVITEKRAEAGEPARC